MLIIKVEKGNIEKALKSFKYKVNKTGQTNALREGKDYTKPSEAKRTKMQKAKYVEQKFNNPE
jgi:small subunit ribosomal protein S21|tara:strand:+ start:550 stop:738 length:189 start_codon:yes stop_codon:yes gene_type:complete